MNTNNLTPTQIQLLATFGPLFGLFAGYFAAWRGIDQGTALGILMAVITGGLSIYNLYATRKSAVVGTVANMPEVKAVVLDRGKDNSHALEQVTPNNVVSE